METTLDPLSQAGPHMGVKVSAKSAHNDGAPSDVASFSLFSSELTAAKSPAQTVRAVAPGDGSAATKREESGSDAVENAEGLISVPILAAPAAQALVTALHASSAEQFTPIDADGAQSKPRIRSERSAYSGATIASPTGRVSRDAELASATIFGIRTKFGDPNDAAIADGEHHSPGDIERRTISDSKIANSFFPSNKAIETANENQAGIFPATPGDPVDSRSVEPGSIDARLAGPAVSLPDTAFAARETAASPHAVQPPQLVSTKHGFAVSAIVQSDADRLEVRLDPPELGKITIDFSNLGATGVKAVVSADLSATLDFLRRNSEQLLVELARQGLTGVDLQFADHPAKDGFAAGGRRGAERAIHFDPPPIEVQAEAPPPAFLSTAYDRFV